MEYEIQTCKDCGLVMDLREWGGISPDECDECGSDNYVVTVVKGEESVKKTFFCLEACDYPDDPFHAALPSLTARDAWLDKRPGDYDYRTHQKNLTFEELDLILEGENTKEVWDAAAVAVEED